jgi:tRNA dimethylallyltransferase
VAPPRPALYAAADARMARMVEAGAIDEVRDLLALGFDPRLPVMKALGVPAFARHLAGATDRATAVAEAARDTRRFAKRQLTWFRHQRPGAGTGTAAWRMAEAKDSQSLADDIVMMVRDRG